MEVTATGVPKLSYCQMSDRWSRAKRATFWISEPLELSSRKICVLSIGSRLFYFVTIYTPDRHNCDCHYCACIASWNKNDKDAMFTAAVQSPDGAVVVVVFFFQYNQNWTSLPSIVLSRFRYAVIDAWSFEDCWNVTPIHLELLVPLTLDTWLPLAELSICFLTIRAEI